MLEAQGQCFNVNDLIGRKGQELINSLDDGGGGVVNVWWSFAGRKSLVKGLLEAGVESGG